MVEKVFIRCTSKDLKKLDQIQHQKIQHPDSATIFSQHVFALCLAINPEGRIEQVKDRLQMPKFSFFYKICKLYRVALIVREATRLIAHNYGTFTPGDQEDMLIWYYPLNLLQSWYHVLQYRLYHPKAYKLLIC